ncbi:MAG: caspase family protein, partial [Nitrospinaceae bacterium]|nr:caspase family protein [Nitrospinaceae bacterium]
MNDKTVDEIPLYVDLTEENSLANVSKLRLPIKKSERARKIQRTVVAGIDQEYGELTLGADLSIDIEQNIPVTGQKNENALAIVFGIENYRNVSPVTFAKRDATFMKEYFEKTLGIPASNIYFKTDENVGKADFDKVFSKRGWLDKRADENTDIYIYYAGHGAPQIKENKAYLIPYDGDPNYPSLTGYALDVLYTNLENLKTRSVTVFLDACFSGANRESEILLAGARPMFMEVNPSAAGNITIFSAASGKEISSAWPEKRHGLFSYFLMKGMRKNSKADANEDGQLTMDELGSYIQTNVSKQAGFLDREQTPQLQTLDRSKVLVN